MGIVKSILDTDLYKLSMSYVYATLFPEAEGEFTFIDRNNLEFDEDFVDQLKQEFYATKSLALTEEEFKWCCKKIPYISEFYFEFLKSWRFDPDKIKVWLDSEKHLHITVTDKMYRATLYEVMILAIVSELLHKRENNTINMEEIIERLDKKIEISNQNSMKFGDMGTRRRYSCLS